MEIRENLLQNFNNSCKAWDKWKYVYQAIIHATKMIYSKYIKILLN